MVVVVVDAVVHEDEVEEEVDGAVEGVVVVFRDDL